MGEALHELHNGALITPRLSNNSSCFVKGNDNIKLFDNLNVMVLRVGKFNTFEGYVVDAVDNDTICRLF
jgi:hypothetical protein